MTDDLSQLEHRLEQATASQGACKGPLDAETASLREGWLALGEILEALQPGPARPLVLREPPQNKRYDGRRAAVMIAVAASLVVGVAVAGRLVRTARLGPVAAFSGGPAAPASQAMTSDTALGGVPSDQGETEPAPAIRGWDDPLDQQIVMAAEEMARVHRDWDHLDEALGTLYYGLEQVEKDLEGSL